jgi:hypothetical protein
MLLDERSPACYINDAMGTGKNANVEFVQTDATVPFGKVGAPWHTFMRVSALRDIAAGDELLVQHKTFSFIFHHVC